MLYSHEYILWMMRYVDEPHDTNSYYIVSLLEGFCLYWTLFYRIVFIVAFYHHSIFVFIPDVFLERSPP